MIYQVTLSSGRIVTAPTGFADPDLALGAAQQIIVAQDGRVLVHSPASQGPVKDDPYDAALRAVDWLEYFEPQGSAMAVDKRAREAARTFAESLRASGIPVPDVGPSPDGGVAMSWVFPTAAGDVEIDVVFLDWRWMEYREGFAERDGFTEEAVLADAQELHSRLLRAAQMIQRAK